MFCCLAVLLNSLTAALIVSLSDKAKVQRWFILGHAMAITARPGRASTQPSPNLFLARDPRPLTCRQPTRPVCRGLTSFHTTQTTHRPVMCCPRSLRLRWARQQHTSQGQIAVGRRRHFLSGGCQAPGNLPVSRWAELSAWDLTVIRNALTAFPLPTRHAMSSVSQGFGRITRRRPRYIGVYLRLKFRGIQEIGGLRRGERCGRREGSWSRIEKPVCCQYTHGTFHRLSADRILQISACGIKPAHWPPVELVRSVERRVTGTTALKPHPRLARWPQNALKTLSDSRARLKFSCTFAPLTAPTLTIQVPCRAS